MLQGESTESQEDTEARLPHIYYVPNEVRQAVLLHLPLDPETLENTRMSCKLFCSLIDSIKFARLHIRYQKTMSGYPELWEFLDTEGIRESKWMALPFSYKVSLYREILLEPNWSKVYSVEDLSHNLMCYRRWRMPPDLAMKVICRLLKAGFPIGSQENRAFRWSARSGYTDVVRMLLKHPDVNPADQNHYAIASTPDIEQPDVVRLLLEDPRIDPSAQNHLALRWACDHDHIETIRLLLAHPGVDPSSSNNYWYETLICLNRGHLDIVKLLLQDPRIDPGDQENAVIRTAADKGHTEIVQHLLNDPRVNPADAQSSALALAAAEGHLEVVKLLMEDGRSQPNTFLNHGIRNAAKKGFHEVVALLLTDPRVDPAVDSNLPLRSSAAEGHVQVVELLLRDARVDPSPINCLPLVHAAENGRLNVVQLLLQDSRVNAVPANFRLAILKAVRKGHVELFEFLWRDARADLYINEVLSCAARSKKHVILKKILEDNRVDDVARQQVLRIVHKLRDMETAKVLLSDSKIFGGKVENLSDVVVRGIITSLLSPSCE
ncbi:ankyrin [Rhizoclosmatium globosum]|uniref:protein S-acyltransferase n=1 Tax=Rhizoclosmatium globosum TaxID=329046 RepID=A0A1Y2CM99_9FUNG|nr:ankyrin [Rhizoclosmatium globosum]|eukprot:ORY48140.1 ankyrin [Rhizoclosmatium globosum]